MWWSNADQRRNYKENIKNVIKRTQNSKKAALKGPLSVSTPPSLCHSVPTSDAFSDSLAPSRAPSVETPPFTDSGFSHISPDGYFAMPPPMHVPSHPQYPMFSPYEVDIKTERQVFVNDVPMRRDSTISTFSTFQPPPSSDGFPAFPADSWVQQDYFESHQESFAEEPVDFDFFDLPHGQMTPNHETVIEVDETDRPLLNHFIDKVLNLIFPILDVNQHGSARSDVILPALESNRCYLHCCLSVAGIHLKSTERIPAEQIDNDIMRHRYATISELCEALSRDTNHSQILEATLGMIFFQCSVGRPDDSLPDIPWHQHFNAATDLVNKLDLPHQLSMSSALPTPSHPPFNMTLTAWIDILGATMLGRSPVFADTYRELNIANSGTGLQELMGCDDKIMFLISEIACLEARKLEGMDEVMLCKYIEILGTEIGLSEPTTAADGGSIVANAFSATGAIRPRQLSANMTAVFRLAARIYLCAMVPGFSAASPSITGLVAAFTDLMNFIPAGPEGFDRSLIWPLLVAGSVSTPASPFRAMFAERCARLGEAAEFGSFGRIAELLGDCWAINDPVLLGSGGLGVGVGVGEGVQSVHWRDVMQQKGWDFLLI